MKITKFWVKGYRSLRDVTLEGLADFNVFHGPNGSGKSNVLEALQTLFALIPIAVDAAYNGDGELLSFRDAGNQAARWIDDDDVFAREAKQAIVLGAELEDLYVPPEGHFVKWLVVELRFSRVRAGWFSLQFTRLRVNGREPGLPFSDPQIRDMLRGLVPQAFTRLVGTIPDGQVVRELFAAKNSSDAGLRRRFKEVRDFLAKTLHRPEFDVYLGTDNSLELRERDIRVDLAGHGVVQMYAIVTSILLAEGRLVAIEEPEAHLHAPTMGRDLRRILQKLVADGRVHQFFIATHSNLFDLDLTGYWDVSLVNGETHVQRKPLAEVDRLHLYEPGPAKHQLQEMLRLYGDEVVFRTGDGRKLTASEMLAALQNDEEVAVAFLENLHAAAMQVTGLRAKLPRREP